MSCIKTRGTLIMPVNMAFGEEHKLLIMQPLLLLSHTPTYGYENYCND